MHIFFSSYSFYCQEERKQTKNVLMKHDKCSSSLYTDEYYTYEYINEMTRFKAEEELVFMTAEELEKTGLINEFI